MSHKHLRKDERYQICQIKMAGFTQATIARELGRASSTISRELGRNIHPCHTNYHYDDIAQDQAEQRRVKAIISDTKWMQARSAMSSANASGRPGRRNRLAVG